MTSSYRSDIQGLRAIAVLLVIIFHYDERLLPSGFMGVDVFFVISGFLITHILIKMKKSPLPVKDKAIEFYRSRIRRIVPAYVFMLIIVGAISAALFLEADYSILSRSLEASFWFNSNNFFASYGSYFTPGMREQPLLHTWSLAIEMQFYLIYPLLFLIFPIKYLKHIVLCIALALVFYYQQIMDSNESSVYYSLLARLPALLFGALPALYGINLNKKNREVVSIAGLLLFLVALIIINKEILYPGYYSLLPIISAVFIIMSSGAILSKWLEKSILVWIGALSYTLYLWHWPVIAFFNYSVGEQWQGFFGGAAFILLTLILSLLSYYVIEKKFRQKNTNIFPENKLRHKFKVIVVGVISLLSFALYYQLLPIVNKKLSPPALSVEYQRYADPSTICHGKIVDDCFKGDLESKTKVLVLGDSHAAMLNAAFDIIGKKENIKFKIITASNCVTISEFDSAKIPKWGKAACDQQKKEVEKLVEKYDFIILAGSWRYQVQKNETDVALELFLNHNNDKKILVLAQIPELVNHPARILRMRRIGLVITQKVRSDYPMGNRVVKRLTKEVEHANWADLSYDKMFRNIPIYEDKLFYYDQSHLNEKGVDLYSVILSPAVKNWRFGNKHSSNM